MIVTLGFGSWFGLVSGQPQLAANLSYFLLMVLLAVFLVDPWLPILERWPAEGGSLATQVELEQKGSLTKVIRKFELVGWIVFLPTVLFVGWRVDWGEVYTDDRSIVLFSYLFLLLFLLLASITGFWIWSLSTRIDSRLKQDRNDLLSGCLARFQIRGWLLLVVVVSMTAI